MRHVIPFLKTAPVVSVVRLQGTIGGMGRSSLTDRSTASMIEKAFSRGKPVAVALEINSPGGSPAQSSLIASRIRRLADEKGIPVYAFVEDVAASGGYWLATAADEIHADASSILGSIGVISAGFGAHVFLQRQGIERRVHTAGASKSMLDPFRPEQEEDVARLNHLLEQLHQTFIAQVRSRRGPKLKHNPALFTGEIWIGQGAVDQGLADGLGHLAPVLKDRFGPKVKIRRYAQKRPFFSRFGVEIARDALGAVEERADFARFGL